MGAMLNRFYRKIGSVIGLLAILMATLAPTVSQALASHEGSYDALDTLCSAQSTNTAGRQDGQADAHALAAHWHACGYCSLLAHLPVLPGAPATFALPAGSVAPRSAARFESVELIAPFKAAQPRAPPRYL
jgi:hypothetical protein